MASQQSPQGTSPHPSASRSGEPTRALDPEARDLRYRFLVEHTRDYAILTMDLDGRVETWNAGAEPLFGYAEAEILGRSSERLFVDEEIAAGQLEAELEAAKATGRADDHCWLRRKDGSRFWGSGVVLLVRDQAGDAAGLAKIVRNADEERGHPAGATGFDPRFRTVVEQVRDYAIFMADPTGHNVSWNEGVRRLLGYEEAEFLGQHGTHIFTPEDRARGEHERELQTAVTDGRASDDRWLVRKDGTRFWVSGVTTRVDDEAGRLVGFSKVFRGLTTQKEAEDRLRESEERLRVALRAAHMGTWRWHLPTNTQRSDPNMSRLLGLGDGEVVDSFELFREHVHPEDRDQVDAAFGSAARTGEDLDVEFRVVWPDGTVRWLADHGQVVRAPDGRPEYLTGAAVDITERKAAEARLVQAQRMDAVGQLAGGVAHEINNMMTAVLGFSELLLDRLALADPARADVAQIRRAASRAAIITGQLLAFGRRQMLQPRVLDLNEVVGGLEPVLRRVLGEDKLLVVDLAAGLSPTRADPGSLEQVLLNLALNARDAMPEGGTLTVRTREETAGRAEHDRPGDREGLAPGHYVVLTVSDTGHGMDAATRARVFEAFFATKPVGQGTGLGLATVQGIVHQSGGAIRLESEPGAGTTFHIYLRRLEGQAAAPGEGADGPPSQAARPEPAILVVEDEELVRSFACRYLVAGGYRCLEAANGAEALELVREHGEEIGLVLSDVVMPVMGGRELAAGLAELQPGLPVLFMSAYAAEEVVRRGLIDSGAPFVQKPFTPGSLATKVRELLRR